MPNNLWDREKGFKYIKIGAFFLGAILLLFVTLLYMRELDAFKGTYLIRVKFKFAEGLRSSSPVRFCGVDIGEVKKVVIKEELGTPIVFVHAKIKNGIKIPKESYFFINSLSLFGEKYLEIDPPPLVEGYLGEGEAIDGISPVPLFKLFASLNETMKEISQFVTEGEIKTSIENTLINLEDITLKVKGIFEDIGNKRGTVGRLLYDPSLYEATEEFVRDLKEHPWKLLHKPKE